MKSKNTLVIATIAAIVTLFTAQAKAQYRPVGDDGIAASPKLRLMLNERARSATVSQASTTVIWTSYRTAGTDRIAASPKLRQMLDEQERNAAATPSSTDVARVGYRATGTDNIAASPKLRQQLDERSTQEFQLAPVK